MAAHEAVADAATKAFVAVAVLLSELDESLSVEGVARLYADTLPIAYDGVLFGRQGHEKVGGGVFEFDVSLQSSESKCERRDGVDEYESQGVVADGVGGYSGRGCPEGVVVCPKSVKPQVEESGERFRVNLSLRE